MAQNGFNGLKLFKVVQKDSISLKMAQYGSKWLIMAHNDIKWFTMVKTGSN